MTKLVGCINCGYRTENKAEIDNFIINGCNCIAADTYCQDCDNGTDTPCKACLAIEEIKDQGYSCGACGEICEPKDGIVSMNSGLIEFTHNADLCPAQDEIEEI